MSCKLIIEYRKSYAERVEARTPEDFGRGTIGEDAAGGSFTVENEKNSQASSGWRSRKRSAE